MLVPRELYMSPFIAVSKLDRQQVLVTFFEAVSRTPSRPKVRQEGTVDLNSKNRNQGEWDVSFIAFSTVQRKLSSQD